ncbi:MAG: hypothetical protein IKH30_07040 [Clostridia bacterium]|nr:hypothetical protein [Clostridia bacterium]
MSAELKMSTYSKVYNWFTWIHIDSYKGLVRIGALFSFFIKLLSPSQYKKYHNEYTAYLSKTEIQYDPKEFKAIIACTLIYGVAVKEYFLYQFAILNDKGRREYITERNRYNIYPYFNGAKKRREMQDKYNAYLALKKFYKREAMYIGEDTSGAEIEAFFAERDSAILKPNASGVGKGVEIFRLSDYEDRKTAFAYLMSKENYIMEELIRQTGLMRSLHPQSVNTVRVYACRLKTGVRIFGCHLRTGIGGSVVDNAGQGGVVISVNDDGIAWTSGMDEFGHTYVYHPDSHVFIPGMIMPEWERAKQLVEDAMQVFPDIRFVGWDIAYSDRGWVIVEANDNGQFYGYQIPHHMGVYKQMMSFVQEL